MPISSSQILTKGLTRAEAGDLLSTIPQQAAVDAAFAKLKVGKIQTNNYAEDASGNATEGAKLDSAGTAIKASGGGLQLGKTNLDHTWFANQTIFSGRVRLFTDTPTIDRAWHMSVVAEAGSTSKIRVRGSPHPYWPDRSFQPVLVLATSRDPQFPITWDGSFGTETDGSPYAVLDCVNSSNVSQARPWPGNANDVFVLFVCSSTGDGLMVF